MKTLTRFAGILILFGVFSSSAKAQLPPPDTLRFTLGQGEQKFIEKNLLLLAGKYEVEIAKAQIIQAKLWDNPGIYLEQNIYNPNSGRYFDVSSSGQNIITVNQLITLAGKRNNRIRLEKINAQISELAFKELLAALKFEYRSNFSELYFRRKTLQMFEEEIRTLKKLVEVFQFQHSRGNVSLREVTRLKALLFSIETERNDLVEKITENTGSLNLLMGNGAAVVLLPILDTVKTNSLSIREVTYSELLSSALENRNDLKLKKEEITRMEAWKRLQHSLSVPDVTVGTVYDRAGSYVQNYTGLSLNFDLPVFNRNQGNIKAAEFQLEQSKLDYERHRREVEQEVLSVYRKLSESENLFRDLDQGFTSDFLVLMEGIVKNFEKRNISLLEFLDYYETFKESMIKLNYLQINRLRDFEEMNLVAGKPIFNY